MFNFKRKKIKNKIRKWEQHNLVNKILPYIHSETYSIRIQAIQALGRIGDKCTIEELKRLLSHKNSFIRKEAENSLLKINPDKEMMNIIKSNRELIKKENDNTGELNITEFDKEFYSWKGRFKRNISRTKAIKESLKKPMRWG